MSEQGKGRYDRSRYGSGARSGRYYDSFFDDMKIPEDEPEQRSFSSRLGIEHVPRSQTKADASASDSSKASESIQDSGVIFGATHAGGLIPRQRAKAEKPSHASASDAVSSNRSNRSNRSSQPARSEQANQVEQANQANQAKQVNQSKQPNRASQTAQPVSSARPAHSASSGATSSAAASSPAANSSQESLSSGGPAHRSYSRAAVEEELAAGNLPKRKKSVAKRVLQVSLVILAVAVLVGAGAAFAYVNSVSGNLRSGVNQELLDVLVETDMANEPFYMLLLGTDRSQYREDRGELDGSYRSDTMILARVDAKERQVTLVSIPRDTLVDIEGYGKQKINSAYTLGGAALAVDTVSTFAGVDISHYAEVDFDGFASIVDALGGVEVNVPVVIDDPNSGGMYDPLYPGVQTIDGDQALVLCRSRHVYDDIGNGDAMRAANQRMVIAAIVQKAVAADIGTIARTVQTVSQYVTTDLALNDIIGLAQMMRGLDPGTDMLTATAPTTSQYVADGWYDYVDKEAWADMMKRVDAGLSPTTTSEVDQQTGVVLASAGDGTTALANAGNLYATVTVKNATEIEGLAASVRTKLMDAGYQNVQIGNVNERYEYPETLIVYNQESREPEAQALLSIVGQGQLHYDEAEEYAMDYTDFIIIIGKDWQQSS